MSYPKVDIKYKQIFNHLPGKYLILNPDLHIVAASDSYLSATLTKRSEIINRYIFDVFPDNPAAPEARATEKLHESLRTVLNTGKAHVMDIQHYDIPKRTDDLVNFETRYWCTSNIPVLDESGNVEYIIHSVDDVTEEVLTRKEIVRKDDHITVIMQKQTETSEALGAMDKRLRLITDIIPALVAYVDKDHRYQFVNESYLRNFKTSHEEIVGKKVEDFLKPYLTQDISKNIEAALKGQIQSFEIRIKLSEDKEQHLEVIYLPDINDQAEVMGFVSMIMDVTDKVKYYDELTSLAQEKERLILQKDEFIEMASHELKTPLTTIKAYVELMLLDIEELDRATLQNYLGKTNSYINQLHRLITGLFDVSTANTGRLPYNFSYFNLADVIEICCNNAQNISKKHKIDCQCTIKDKMYGDKERLEQVIDSLLNNAVKYSPDHNDILLKAEEINNEVLITVKDRGIGIPDEELNNIFKRFSRAHALSYHNSGLGLGLYLSREIVDRHRGKIWAESEIGKGSTFFVKLPAKPAVR